MRLVPAARYMIEPLPHGPTAFWEGHHATNPCCLRLSGESRVLLGYRAGGVDDWFRCGDHTSWASHLGLAVLDVLGESVVCPLPIMKIDPPVALPKSSAEFDMYRKGPDRDRIAVLHDFRFWEDSGWVYVIYHEGTVNEVYDCLVRMSAKNFSRRVDASIKLSLEPTPDIESAWRALWWEAGVWEAAGIDGTNRIYGSEVVENDIVFLRRTDGGITMLHRPVPDIAAVETDGKTYAPVAPDGLAAFGSLQSCVRPGFSDNSHLGNNGSPTSVRIGQRHFFVDIVHGVRNQRITELSENGGWRLTYEPYIRLLNADNGACVYYSEEPILLEDPWKEYTQFGEWVKALPHLDSVMFAGGQVPREAELCGLDDEFQTYIGVGDTAVARATFRLRHLLPAAVIEDLSGEADIEAVPTRLITGASIRISEESCGWSWSLINREAQRAVGIVRELPDPEGGERNIRRVDARPGYFDAHGLWMSEQTPVAVDDWGWLVVYQDQRWDVNPKGYKRTQAGLGILVLDRENPERVLYRSTLPIGRIREADGWTDLSAAESWKDEDLLRSIPEKVRREAAYIHQGKWVPSNMTRWLREKSEQLLRPSPSGSAA
jgi:predicted GH43/DUF377 family glycosyl hydrolase